MTETAWNIPRSEVQRGLLWQQRLSGQHQSRAFPVRAGWRHFRNDGHSLQSRGLPLIGQAYSPPHPHMCAAHIRHAPRMLHTSQEHTHSHLTYHKRHIHHTRRKHTPHTSHTPHTYITHATYTTPTSPCHASMCCDDAMEPVAPWWLWEGR
jgi:hypothetical protein